MCVCVFFKIKGKSWVYMVSFRFKTFGVFKLWYVGMKYKVYIIKLTNVNQINKCEDMSKFNLEKKTH